MSRPENSWLRNRFIVPKEIAKSGLTIKLPDIQLIILLLFFLCIPGKANSQDHTSINLEEIPHRKVRKYIHSKEIDQMDDFSLIHASWTKGTEESAFSVTEETFYLNKSLPEVWNCYSHADLSKTWSRHSARFDLLIIKSPGMVFYPDNPDIPEADTGQVYFLDLRFLIGLFNVPVSFEIITIDYLQKIVEFSYIENNKSEGKQVIQFFDNGDEGTRIVHRSYFRSGSKFRDAHIYPFFHKRFVKEFHHDMGQLVDKYVLKYGE